MKNPLVLMGAITGNPSKEEINNMMHLYAEKNLKTFLIYARSGCEIEYMSDRWIEVCKDVIEAAQRENIDVWIYDEYNWPSGTCGKKVMKKNNDFCSVRVKVIDGECKLIQEKSYADILNPKAVDCFIENTHEVYYKYFGEYFGNVIKGFFTDEPDAFYSVWKEGDFPYSKDIDIEYEQKYGRNLFEDMAAEHLSEQFKINYWDIIEKRFKENYIGKLNDWCVSHNVFLTGHLIYEHILENSVKSCGNPIKVLRCMSIPAVDELQGFTELKNAEWLTLGIVEAAARFVGNGSWAELFSVNETDVVPGRIEQIIWLFSMFKVDKYLLAVSAFDAKGNYEKRVYYNPMNYTSPWFEGYSVLGKSAAIAAGFAKKKIASEVFVRYPVSICKKNLFGDNEGLINKRLYSVLQELTRRQYQWQFADEDEVLPDGVCEIQITDDDSFSLDGIMNYVDKKIKREIKVYENGELADELLLRKFADGSTVILDLKNSKQQRELVINNNGVETKIMLDGRGHYVIGENFYEKEEVIQTIKPSFKFSLGKENTLRCNLNHENLEYSFFVSEEIPDVQLAIRNYRYDGEITLDGNKIKPIRECECLMPGFNNIYKCTDKFTLTCGEHTVTTSIAADSEFFLPTCLVCGKFASDNNDKLRKLPNEVFCGRIDTDIIPQYAGSVIYEANLDIPSEQCAIKFDSSQLCTSLYIENILIDTMLSGYCFDIPDQYLGKRAKFKIVQYTSIAPMFGRKADADQSYRCVYNENYKCCGIDNLKFISKK